VNSKAVLAGIFGSLAATLLVARYTQGRGLWALSPQAIGIMTACVVVGAITLWGIWKSRQGVIEKSGDRVIR